MRRRVNYLYTFDFISDVLVVFISYVAAMFLRYEVMTSKPGLKTLSLPYLLVALIYSIVIASIFGYMNSSNRFFYRTKNNGAYNMFIINAIGCVCLMSFFYIIGLVYFSRGALLFFWCISSALILLKKDALFPLLKDKLMKGNRIKALERKILLVGDGEKARDYFSAVNENKYIWIDVIGYVGEEKDSISSDDNTLERLGGYKDIINIIDNADIDEVVFAVDNKKDISKVYFDLKNKNISISMIPDNYELMSLNSSVHEVGHVNVIDLNDNSKGLFGRVACLGLILSSSLLLISLMLNVFEIGFLQEYKIYGTYKSILFAVFGFCMLSVLFERFKKGNWVVTKLALASWISCVAFATIFELLDNLGEVILLDLRMDVIVITITIIVSWIVYGIIRSLENDSTPLLF